MGGSLSTRNIPDYVYVHFYENPDESITVKFSVFDTNLRYQLRQYMRDKDDQEREIEKQSKEVPILPTPSNPRRESLVYLGLHSCIEGDVKVDIHPTKTLEELLLEREQFDKELSTQMTEMPNKIQGVSLIDTVQYETLTSNED